MSYANEWDLSRIPNLSTWLFNGLMAVYNGKTFSDRKYPLLPIELNDSDYVSLQICRQVRTFDAKSLPALASANDDAIGSWQPTYGIAPLLDMIGIIQELGSRSLEQHITALTMPSTLNRMSESDVERLLSALVEALVPQSAFRFDGALYASFLKLATSHSPLPSRIVARALAVLVRKHPRDWKTVVRHCSDYFRREADPAQSPLAIVFFAIEESLTRDEFNALFMPGGHDSFLPEEMWLIPWLFTSRDPQRPTETPLELTNARDAFWIKFASRPDQVLELKKDSIAHRIVTTLTGLVAAGAGPKVTALSPAVANAANEVTGAPDQEEQSLKNVIQIALAGRK